VAAPPPRRDSFIGAAGVEPIHRLPFAWPFAILSGAAAVALAAQVAVPLPISPVPMTLQGLAVLLVGGLLGGTAGAGAMVLYLAAGAVGLPVFAPVGPPGLARLVGPTGGYLLAFPVAAVIAGRLAQRGRFAHCLVAALAAMVAIHAAGWAQLSLLTGRPASALALGITPFLAQDLLKVLIAALVFWRGHLALRPRA
jgi:biotin transport system substrate-specific component